VCLGVEQWIQADTDSSMVWLRSYLSSILRRFRKLLQSSRPRQGPRFLW
jgi:hypothetical protein